MNKYKKLAVNTGIFAIGNFGSKILVILLTRLYTKHISPESLYTKDLLELIALFLLPIFTLSMTEAIIRYGLDKKYKQEEVFTTASTITLIGLGAMIFIMPFLKFVPFLKEIDGYTILLTVYVCTSGIRSLCSQFARARGMVELFSLDGILATLSLFLFNIIFIAKLQWGVKGFMISVILSDFCSAVFLFIVARLDRFVGIKYFNKKLGKSMTKFTLPLIITIVMWTITGLSDRIFIRNMHSTRVALGSGPAGLYGVANKIPNLISMVSTIFFQAWNMSAIMENNSKDRSKFYEKVYGAYESLLFIAGAFLILTVKFVSSILSSTQNYAEYGEVYKYTPFLIIAVIFTCLDQFLGSIYTATKHTENSFWTSLIACAVNIILNIELIPEWGIQGASIATFLSYYICFWARIIDARYYIPFGFSWKKSAVNTVSILVMCLLTVFQPPFYIAYVAVLTVLVTFLNYKSLLATAMKLIKR